MSGKGFKVWVEGLDRWKEGWAIFFLAGFEGGLFLEGGFEGAGELVGAGGAFTAALDAFAACNYVGDFHAAG